ncbi:MAG: SDR family oxidoreductase [Sphingobium sp.]|nr:SDR family oxidoreductase [Sphingobium sp.]
MTRFKDKHIVITGASTGIGRATADLIASEGGKVTLLARRPEILTQAVEKIQTAGGIATSFAVDISDKAALIDSLDKAALTQGPIDGLFVNAGTSGAFAPLGSYDDALFEDVLRTNLISPFWAIKHVLPTMIERKQGAILVTGSLASERGMANNAGYVASKHAILGLSRATAIEAAPHGVRANCLIPGFIETPLMGNIDDAIAAQLCSKIPQGRMGSAHETAQVAAFLLSDQASHVTGQSWAADGGVLGGLMV